MSLRGFIFVVCAVFSVLLLFGMISVGDAIARSESVFASTEAEAGVAIAEAEGKIVVCYGAIAEADRVGANTSALLIVLNEAGNILSRAKLAYKLGNFDHAVSLALQSQEQLNSFVDEADVLRGAAMQVRSLDFMVNVVGSIIGAVAVVLGGLIAWIILKRKYLHAGSVAQ